MMNNNSVRLSLVFLLLFSSLWPANAPALALSWDEEIIAGSTQIKAFHINELRQSIEDVDQRIQWQAGPGSDIYYDAGAVGIGTATPEAALDVVGDIKLHWNEGYRNRGARTLTLEGYGSLSGSEFARIDLNGGDAGYFYTGARISATNAQNAASGDLRFYTTSQGGVLSSDPQLVIDPDGKVGIGTATPQTALHVTNAIGGLTTSVVQNSSSAISDNTGAAQVVQSNGASVALTTFGSEASGTYRSGELDKADAVFLRTASDLPPAALNIGTGSSAPIRFFTGDRARMSVASNGYVGINTLSPSEQLEVLGNARISNQLNTKRLAVDWEASVGRNLDVGRGLTVGYGASIAYGLDVGYGATINYDLIVNRKVGIGTASPAKKLHVAGDAQIDGTLKLGTHHICQAADEGELRYTSGRVSFCDGTQWQVLALE